MSTITWLSTIQITQAVVMLINHHISIREIYKNMRDSYISREPYDRSKAD